MDILEEEEERTVSEKRYNALKRKYKYLEEENADLAENLDKSKRLIRQLTTEKCYLIDRLLKYETLSSSSESEEDSDTSTASESSTETESEIDIERQKRRAAAQPIITVDSEALGLCVAVVKNRPCKSKALSGSKYCWHHAPLDPASMTIWCKYRDPNKRNKKCSIPVPKTKKYPFCQYHQKKGKEQMKKDGSLIKGDGEDASGDGSAEEKRGKKRKRKASKTEEGGEEIDVKKTKQVLEGTVSTENETTKEESTNQTTIVDVVE